MLKVTGLGVNYRGLEAVRDVSFHLQAGQWLMLAGPNGAGKSSLLQAVAQTVPATGSILVGGDEARRLPARTLARRLAVLRQTHSLGYAFTVEQLVSLGRYAHQGAFSRGDPQGRQKVEEALALCGLDQIRKQNALTLSGGELQRAFLAQVFAQDAPLLLLDEPASHLDLAYQQSIFGLIALWLRTPGRAVMSVVHDLQLARRYGSHVLLMREGRSLAWGPIDQALTDHHLQEAYGLDVRAWFTWLQDPWVDGQNPPN
ncbi:MAG: ABC transporter ATP-binding protein [Clostridiales bacterium]|nr:ABC transporter ATP-binding protein [Clostridiales bacterium]